MKTTVLMKVIRKVTITLIIRNNPISPSRRTVRMKTVLMKVMIKLITKEKEINTLSV